VGVAGPSGIGGDLVEVAVAVGEAGRPGSEVLGAGEEVLLVNIAAAVGDDEVVGAVVGVAGPGGKVVDLGAGGQWFGAVEAGAVLQLDEMGAEGLQGDAVGAEQEPLEAGHLVVMYGRLGGPAVEPGKDAVASSLLGGWACSGEHGSDSRWGANLAVVARADAGRLIPHCRAEDGTLHRSYSGGAT